MAQLTIRINGYAYTVSCEDGQESHLQAMAQEIETRVGNIKAMGSQSGEARLLVLAALLMADELHDLRIEIGSLRKTFSAQQKVASSFRAAKDNGRDTARESRLANLVRRAEEIAAGLEHA